MADKRSKWRGEEHFSLTAAGDVRESEITPNLSNLMGRRHRQHQPVRLAWSMENTGGERHGCAVRPCPVFKRMLTSEQCKAHAAECLQLAQTAASPEQKALLSGSGAGVESHSPGSRVTAGAASDGRRPGTRLKAR